MTDKIHLHVLSDSIGETAELLARAASIQFDPKLIGNIHRYSFVSEKFMIDNIIRDATNHKSIIVYTLVKQEMRDYLSQEASNRGIPAIDGLGPIIRVLSSMTNSEPKREIGLNRKMNDEYFEKVEAVEFAVKYDDGKDPNGIIKADIVLLGVSRTSKTPLSMYLAYRNYKVCNIPLVPEVELPHEIFQINPKKIIGLTNDPEILNTIRLERLKDLGISTNSTYAKMDRIMAELEYAHALFGKIGCPVINVSTKAIEETASIITALIANSNNTN